MATLGSKAEETIFRRGIIEFADNPVTITAIGYGGLGNTVSRKQHPEVGATPRSDDLARH